MAWSDWVAASKRNLDPDALVEELQRWIQARTENPPGEEGAIASLVSERLQKLGFHVAEHRVAGRPNWIATKTYGCAAGGGPTLLFNGHVDVVPAHAADWKYPPYAAVVEDGRVYGRGSADMKGGIVSFLHAVQLAESFGASLQGRLVVSLVSDEETMGECGTGFLARSGLLAADAAIVGEPTDLNPCTCERGAVWARVTCRGRAAHGSTPHLGINALEPLARLILDLLAWRPELEHPVLGAPTLNVGTFRGGSKINIVPDWAEAEIDRRTVPGENTGEVIEWLRQRVAAVAQLHPRARLHLEVLGAAEPTEVAVSDPIVQLALEAVRAVRGDGAEGRSPRLAGMPAVTDARFLVHDCGIPTVLLGPGSLSQAHTVDEFVPIEDLLDAARIYSLIIAGFLRPA